MLALPPLLGLALLPSALALPDSPLATTPVFKFASPTAWAENLAVRPNGHVLVTRMDNGELWSVDPAAGGNATLVHAFAARSATGIAETRPDVFAVVTGDNDVAVQGSNVAGSYAVWTVDMNVHPPAVVRANLLPELVSVNGIAAIGEDSVVVGDIAKGTVSCIKVGGGACGPAFADLESLGPPSEGPPYGIDGMKFRDGTLWFTNIGKKTFNKVGLDKTGKPTGPVVQLQTGLLADDLAFGPDGSIYLTTNFDKTVVKLSPDGKGTPVVVANIDGACACQFGRAAADKNILYVTTSHGELWAVKV